MPRALTLTEERTKAHRRGRRRWRSLPTLRFCTSVSPDSGEMEGEDRADMLLPENQIELLKAIAAVNENIVVVLSCGCAVEMQWHRYAKAVVHGYLGGQAGAMAMARLLTGAGQLLRQACGDRAAQPRRRAVLAVFSRHGGDGGAPRGAYTLATATMRRRRSRRCTRSASG